MSFFLHIFSEILKHDVQETQAIPETFLPWVIQSETIDDITLVVRCRFLEPMKINSFPLSGPAGSLVCQWAVTIAVQGWAWPVNCCWQEENMLTATGTSQNTDLHFSLPSKETQSKAIFKTQGILYWRPGWRGGEEEERRGEERRARGGATPVFYSTST